MIQRKAFQRYEALDGLRGIAALLVVFYHVRWTNHVTHTNAIRHAFLFVDLFFMLSGFVLAASYMNRIRSIAEIGNFLCLRFFRIYPLHFAILIVLISLEIFKVVGRQTGLMISIREPFSTPNTVEDIFLNLFLVQSLHTTDHLSWNNPSWSISCEAAGYVVFSLVTFAGLIKTKTFHLVAVPAAICGYVLVLSLKGTLDATFDIGIVRCLAGLFLGVWAYNLTPLTSLSSISTGVLSIVAIFLSCWVGVTLAFARGETEIFVLPGFLFALLYLHQDRGYGAKLLKTKMLQFLGRVSYSIYMVHFPVLVVISIVLKRIVPPSTFLSSGVDLPQLNINPWIGDVMLLGVVLLILLISYISFSCIEKPWREYGRYQARSS